MEDLYTYPQLAALQGIEKWEIPENYFAELPAHIMTKIGIADLVEKTNMVETVEESYFDTFFGRLQERIEAEGMNIDTPLLDAIPKDTIWQMPAGYFEDFSEKIGEKVEEKALAPVLFSIEKPVYELPSSYFEGLHTQIVAKIADEKSAKVLNFVPNWSRRILNYGAAIAASVILVLGGMWLLPQKTQENTQDFAPNFSQISTEELQQAIENEDIDEDLLAEVLPVNYTPQTAKDLPEIDDISEEELLNYLEKEGEL